MPDPIGKRDLRVALLTREYPPEVYGGAGVHVEYLSRELARLTDITVHCWGQPRPAPDSIDPVVATYDAWEALAGPEPELAALRAVSIDLTMAAAVGGADVLHSHTWYAQFAGHLGKLIHGVPHVATVHSLEPLRPWKAEQLGGGYALSSFCERTALTAADAVIAVSAENRRDILSVYPEVAPDRVHVIYNGIDTNEYRPDPGTDALTRYGVDPDRPSVVFVGRITRQKGVGLLLQAALDIEPGAQLVLCAGSPDTPELRAEIAAAVDRVRRERGDVVWLEAMLTKSEIVQLLSHATVFVCPSVYEPLGIVNLEAMACEAAVVATRTGGIPEVVAEGETGSLVDFDPVDDGSRAPKDPAGFAAAMAAAVNALLADPDRARRMGQAGRRRAVEHFSWTAIAEQTVALYQRVCAGT